MSDINKYLHFRELLRKNHNNDNSLKHLIYGKIKADHLDISFLCNYGNIDCIIDDEEYGSFLDWCLNIDYEYIIKALLNNTRYDPSIKNYMLMAKASTKNMNEIAPL